MTDLHALQDLQELRYFINLAKTLNVKRYLEIGSYQGATLALIAKVCTPDLMVSIDLEVMDQTPSSIIEELKGNEINVHYLKGDSKDPEIISKAKSLGPYDMIFIDGDHTYDGVKADWENYRDTTPVIVFHDIYATNNYVSQFWHDLRWSDQSFREIREFRTPKTDMGYGVIFK